MAQCGSLAWPSNVSQCTVFTNNSTSYLQQARTGQGGGISVQCVAELYVISILCLIGLIGNSVSISVLRQDKERREALFLLQMLAVADSLYLLVSIFRYPLKYLLPDKNQFITMQPYVFPSLKTCQTFCIWMMVLVTTERFIYVCKPLHAQRLFNRRARRVLASLVFVIGLLFNVPRFLDQCTFVLHNLCTNRTTVTMVYRPAFRDQLYYNIYRNALYIVCLYLLPLAILSVINIKLIQAIQRSRRRHREISYTGVSNPAVHETNATLVLVIIILVFIVCESPELVLKILSIVHRHVKTVSMFSGDDLDSHLLNLTIASEVLMVINSSTNFFIYLLFGKRFRAALKETFSYRFSTTTTFLTHESFPLQRQNQIQG